MSESEQMTSSSTKQRPEGWFTPPVIIPILLVLAVAGTAIARNWGLG